jgi:Sec-independent protein secretion pathway component TatC
MKISKSITPLIVKLINEADRNSPKKLQKERRYEIFACLIIGEITTNPQRNHGKYQQIDRCNK